MYIGIDFSLEWLSDYAMHVPSSEIKKRISDYSIMMPWEYERTHYNEQMMARGGISVHHVVDYLHLDMPDRAMVLQSFWRKCFDQKQRYAQTWRVECLSMREYQIDQARKYWAQRGIETNELHDRLYVIHTSARWHHAQFDVSHQGFMRHAGEFGLFSISFQHPNHVSIWSDAWSQRDVFRLHQLDYDQRGDVSRARECGWILDTIETIQCEFEAYCQKQDVLYWTMSP